MLLVYYPSLDSQNYSVCMLGDSRKVQLHRCIQAVDESIADYDTVLRKLTIYCEFEATLEETLKDWFVCI